MSLECFRCSELPTRVVSCPGSRDDPAAWREDEEKFTSVEGGAGLQCSIVTASETQSGRVGEILLVLCRFWSYLPPGCAGVGVLH